MNQDFQNVKDKHLREYSQDSSVVFRKTKEEWGGLSNMAAGFPLKINGVDIRTSEALYQACRFPHMPHVQQTIIDQRSPMSAKMKSKPYRNNSRKDWDAARVKIMRWCLHVKLAQNWDSFGSLLESTEGKDIVEWSRKDDFWGAKMRNDGMLVGKNVLGRLLMELRDKLLSDKDKELLKIEPLDINDFKLLNKPIPTLKCISNDKVPEITPIPDIKSQTIIPNESDLFGDSCQHPLDIIQESEEISRWIEDRITKLTIRTDDRTRVALGCFKLAIEHQIAVWLLVKNKRHGSAFALARCIFESYVRGEWFSRCAQDQNIDQFVKLDKLDKTIHDMVIEIEKSYEMINEAPLSKTKSETWKQLNSFTHTGALQVHCQFTESGLESNYPDSEITNLCRFSNRWALQAGMGVASLSPDVTENLMKEFYYKVTEKESVTP